MAHQLGLPQEEMAPNDAPEAPAPQAEVQAERPMRSRERRAEARRREREAAAENKAFENQTEIKAEPKEEAQRRRETAHKAADQLKAASKAAVAKSAAKASVKEAPEKPVAQANLRIADRLREKLGVARKAKMPQLNEILEQAAQRQAEKAGAVEAIDLSDAVEKLLQRLRAHWEKSPLPKPQPVEQPAPRFEQKFEPKSEQKTEQKSEATVSEPRRARSRRDLGRATQQAAAAQPVEAESNDSRVESRRFESKRDERRDSSDRRERRERVEKTERRGARFSLQSADALLAVAYETLQQSGSPMAGPALMDAVEKRLSARGLKSAILAENAHRLSMGLRPRFALCNDGTVALTEWKLSPRYLEAERQFEKAQLELHEALKAELLLKIANLRDGAFAGLLAMLLGRMGYSAFGAVQQQGGLWQFTALHAGQKVAFAIQRRSAQADACAQWCDAFEETGAKRGIWVALGDVSEAPEQAPSAVEFVDGAAFADWLCQAELGVLSHKFVDEAFFESLA